MKLWTLHRDCVADSLDRQHVADWEFTPTNWREIYRWMVYFMSRHLGHEFVDAPVWCWHSCDGKFASGPTVETAEALMGDWEYYAHQTRVIELDVPDRLPLLSSYWGWNELMDLAIETNAVPALDSSFVAMFDPPYFQHDTDDIQAVLPYIEPEWVVAVRRLPAIAERRTDFI
jgi:hypothetical protein